MRDVTSTMDDVRHVLANWPLPPEGGWTADDLDLLPEDGPHGELDLFKRVELVDGALVLMSPQKLFHESIIIGLRIALDAQAPEGLSARSQMDIKIAPRQRPCPDVLVVDTTATTDLNRTAFAPKDVHLVVEVVSPESEHRDNHVKPGIYAAAGIEHFWIVKDENSKPVIHTYELDEVVGAYVATGIHRDRLAVSVPFPIDITLDALH
ncbi:Uma2 family endonuclease [Nonomuraea sp. NPDC003804]|uniref:Uma2 family endonuclease n=1 Tax=Nonomuraea sp. NPDC003804 TaxID=3154547 RepID=UPI0033AEB67A